MPKGTADLFKSILRGNRNLRNFYWKLQRIECSISSNICIPIQLKKYQISTKNLTILTTADDKLPKGTTD